MIHSYNKDEMMVGKPILHSLNQDEEKQINLLRDDAMKSLKKGDFIDAKNSCINILNINPEYSDAYYMLAMIAGENTQISSALKTLDMAIDLGPDKVEYYAQKARFLLLFARNTEATEITLKAYDMGSEDPFQLDTIGCALSQLGYQTQAEEMFLKATIASPQNAQYHYNHGNALRFLGRFDQAEIAFEKSINLRKHHYKSHWALSDIKKQTSGENHIPRLEEMTTQLKENQKAQSFLHYALGKEYEDQDNFDQAFHHFQKGASAQRNLIDYDIKKDEELIDCLINNFDQNFFEQEISRNDSYEPIFILGLPRSGTTLVERILNCHDDVFAAGELLNFGIEVKKLSAIDGRDLLIPDVVEGVMNKNLNLLAQSYLDSTRPSTGHNAHFIDKLPLNYLYVGLIAKLFPNAAIINLNRNAMDSCFSMFKQKFALAYHFSYDLREIGQYYLLYKRLMAHWHKCLPNRILDVSYEELVTDQQQVSKKIFQHCNLEWQDSFLDFHKNRTAVTTASATQVRQPIYQTSVRKWQNYDKYLSPLKDILTASGIKIQEIPLRCNG